MSQLLEYALCCVSFMNCAQTLMDVPDADQISCAFERIDARALGAEERFRNLRETSPIVLTNSISHWKAFQTWEWNPLNTKVGHLTLSSEDVHPGVLGDGWEEGVSLSHVMDTISTKPKLLLLKPQSPIVQSLQLDFDVPPLLDNVRQYGPHLSIGGKGQAAVFNHHQTNWLAQVFGRKLWMVYAPESGGDPIYANTAHPCQYLQFEHELAKPLRRLRTCVIHPGETVFLPEKWPHATCNLDNYTVGVGYFGNVSNMSIAERAAVVGNLTLLKQELRTRRSTGYDHVLYIAAEAGHTAVVQAMLETGANTTNVDAWGRSALHLAAKVGWPDVVTLLMHRRARVYTQDRSGNTPLIESCFAGNLRVVRALCGCSNMLSEAQEGRRGKQCNGLTECANFIGKRGVTPLKAAAKGGHVPVASFLLLADTVVTDTGRTDDDTPLALAATNGHSTFIVFLLDRRADINGGRTAALSLAAKRGHEGVVQKLIHRGANVSSATSSGQTALMFAVRRQSVAVVKLLLGGRAQVDALDYEHRSAMHVAAKSNRPEHLELLLAARANADVPDQQGTTPFDAATRVGHVSVLRKLLAREGLNAGALVSKALHDLESLPDDPFRSESKLFLENMRDNVREL